MGSKPSELSMVRITSARPSGGRPAVPAKMTSSILPPRSVFAPCSPSTQAIASTTLLLPEPFGPTTAVIPDSNRSVVAEAKDLNPLSVSDLRCTNLPRRQVRAPGAAVRSRDTDTNARAARHRCAEPTDTRELTARPGSAGGESVSDQARAGCAV